VKPLRGAPSDLLAEFADVRTAHATRRAYATRHAFVAARPASPAGAFARGAA
jgi:hypothetical protein